MAIDPIQLTKQLVDIESTTYHEAPAGEFLAALLAEQGYSIERQPVPQPDPVRTPGCGTGPRFNVYAHKAGVIPAVVFSTHMDTVPPFLGPCREDETHLYGRGTCDAKGIISTQIAAAGHGWYSRPWKLGCGACRYRLLSTSCRPIELFPPTG